MSNAWEKTGRDGAHEDIAAKGPPCTTLDEARERCAAWLRGVEGADVDAAAEGYLAAWQAHARDNAPPLDLDATVAAVDYLRPVAPETARHADALAAEVRRLRAERDDLVARVWRAAGEEHEPPARVGAAVARVVDQRAMLSRYREAMLDVHEALDGVRPEPDFDMPAELGDYACEEVARLKAAAVPAGYVAIPQELHDAATIAAAVERRVAVAAWAVVFGEMGAPMPPEANGVGVDAVATVARTVRSVLDAEREVARREGAEAMREACIREHRKRGDEADFRALPLPGGEP